MLTSIVLPLFVLDCLVFTTPFIHLSNIYKTHSFFSALTIFLQVVFIDQILPYNSQFNTKFLLFQYIDSLWQSYYTN